MPLRTAAPSPVSSPVATAIAGDRLTTGEYVPVRTDFNSTSAGPGATGVLVLSFFTADKSEPINNLRVTTSTVAAAATPTLCRMGVYAVNAAGDLTALVASTANDTTLFASTLTQYTKALTTQFDKVAGSRYALAMLVVSAAAVPTFLGALPSPNTAVINFGQNFELPALCSRVTATQTDLGASYTRAQQSAFAYRVGFLLT